MVDPHIVTHSNAKWYHDVVPLGVKVSAVIVFSKKTNLILVDISVGCSEIYTNMHAYFEGHYKRRDKFIIFHSILLALSVVIYLTSRSRVV